MVERSMQGINKIASISRSSCLYTFVYNSWPHSVTKILSAELMFGRPRRTLLPNLKLGMKFNDDDELRDRDKLAKFMRNSKEDEPRQAQELEINVGDTVLMMQVKCDKTDTTYKDVYFKITKIEGNGRVTIIDPSSDRIYERNVKQLENLMVLLMSTITGIYMAGTEERPIEEKPNRERKALE